MTRRAELIERLPIVLGLPELEAAAAIGVSLSFFRELVEDGRMPKPRVLNNRQIYDIDDLRAAFKNLPHKGELPSSKWSAVR